LTQFPVKHTLSLPQDASAEQLAKLTWAIAHPARVRIVQLLLSRTSCVCGEIVDQMPLAQSNDSIAVRSVAAVCGYSQDELASLPVRVHAIQHSDQGEFQPMLKEKT